LTESLIACNTDKCKQSFSGIESDNNLNQMNQMNQKIGRTQRENTVSSVMESLDNSPTDVSVLLWDLFEDMLICDYKDFKFILGEFNWLNYFLNGLREALSSDNVNDLQFFIESNRELVDQLVYGGETLTHDYDIEVLLSLRKSIKNLQYKIANFNVG
jgi:hypothetical protein